MTCWGAVQGVKALGDGALAQLPAEAWHLPLAPGGNSAAVLMQHLSGNMHSRWGAVQRGFTGDIEGESAGRNRDAEFTEGQQTPAELLERWEGGWAVFFNALAAL